MDSSARPQGFDRRVYRREFMGIIGYGATWFREQQRRGRIPIGKRDPGGKREWWLASEIAETLATFDKEAVSGSMTAAIRGRDGERKAAAHE
ncbi:MAG: hypothetical protein WKH97_03025 [Casimicrobiaceae bacterium]